MLEGDPQKSRQGLILVFTGNGKGKTTAALGQALRAAGHGLKVCVLQFIKGKWPTGEARAFQRLSDEVEFHVLGSGFTWEAESHEAAARVGRAAWDTAREKIGSGRFDLVVLDELTYLLNYGMIREEDCLAVLRERPAGLHVVITGRDASRGVVDLADLVTEMREVKHPYASGVKASKGIEF